MSRRRRPHRHPHVRPAGKIGPEYAPRADEWDKFLARRAKSPVIRSMFSWRVQYLPDLATGVKSAAKAKGLVDFVTPGDLGRAKPKPKPEAEQS